MKIPSLNRSEAGRLRAYAAVTIAGVLGIFAWGLYSFFGPHWWRILLFLLVLIAVPLLFWTVARVRDLYTRRISTKFGLSFSPGFPSIPPGSPAHGRSPTGFTGYTLSRREGRATLNLYEQSYAVGGGSGAPGGTRRSGRAHRAHGLWWQYDDPLFPEFEVRGRNLLTAMHSAMASALASVRDKINFGDDIEFSTRLTVAGYQTSAMVSAHDEINFGDDPEFSTRFIVYGTAEDQIRRLLTPQLCQALLKEVDRGTVGGMGHVLAWDRRGRLWGERALGKLILRGERLRQAFEVAAQGIQ